VAKTEFLTSKTDSLSSLLLKRKLVQKDRLYAARRLSKKHKNRIEEILLNEGFINEEGMGRVLAEHFKVPYVDLKKNPCDRELLLKTEVDRYIKFNFLPWRKQGNIVYIATTKVTNELFLHLKKRYSCGFRVVIATSRGIVSTIQRNFSDLITKKVKTELKNSYPQYSARTLLKLNQKVIVFCCISILLISIFVLPSLFLNLLLVGINIVFIVNMVFKFFIFFSSLGEDKYPSYKKIKESTLPTYTILLPLYAESSSIPGLLSNIKKLNYPKEKLDVIIIVEQFDKQTIRFLNRQNKENFFRIICVPRSYPKTKPKACSYALKFARSSTYLTIYDAEDRPDPDQLLKAVSLFRQSPEKVVCLQACLNYYNRKDNMLSALFSIEFSIWFDFFLRGLERLNIPIPLGGSSNHFKLNKLREFKGWDPYNVTEDADLGYRLAKQGYRTKILNSFTMEESPISVKVWLLQRARWIKGHMQTYIVHLRTVNNFKKHFNRRGMLGFHFFLIIPIVSYFFQILLPVVFFLSADTAFVYVMKLTTILICLLWVIVSLFFARYVVVKNRWRNMSSSVILSPFYYFLHSVAFFIAIYQLLFKPHYWDKTLRKLDM
jgi:glycosyltransferase XagB